MWMINGSVTMDSMRLTAAVDTTGARSWSAIPVPAAPAGVEFRG
jgi:hypothetical protein